RDGEPVPVVAERRPPGGRGASRGNGEPGRAHGGDHGNEERTHARTERINRARGCLDRRGRWRGRGRRHDNGGAPCAGGTRVNTATLPKLSADAHVDEPHDLWFERVDEEL